MVDTLIGFVRQSIRVLRVSYQPKADEFNMTAKVTGLGLILIGVIGYVITIIFSFI